MEGLDNLHFADLTYQQTFDIMEAYAYTKKGSNTAHHKLLSLIKHKYNTGEVKLEDVDEALLLANAVIELSPQAPDKEIEQMRSDLLEMSIEFLEKQREDIKHID